MLVSLCGVGFGSLAMRFSGGHLGKILEDTVVSSWFLRMYVILS